MRKLLVIILLCFAESSCETFKKTWAMELLEAKDNEHTRLNELFERVINTSTCIDIKSMRQKIENNSLPKLLTEYISGRTDHSYDPVIIHLYAKDFYEHNYNDILNNNFIYAGDLKKTIKTGSVHKCNRKEDRTLQKKNDTEDKKTNEYRDEIYQENCETVTYNKQSAKIVSKNVHNYPLLHDYIVNFDGTDDLSVLDHIIESCKSSMNIVICDSSYHDFSNRYEYTFEIRNESNCNDINFDHSTVVILAPTPFNVSQTVNTTTIFYGDSYITSDAENMFENSFHWMPLIKTKFALLEFMKLNHWNRVAIISDSSSANTEYERELTALFDEENVVYASRSCDVLNCDFKGLLRPLLVARARLVIVNIGEEYATEFTSQITQMQPQQNIAWIVKGWSKDAAKKASEMGIGDVFSIRLKLDNPGDDVQKLIDFIKTQLNTYIRSKNKKYMRNDEYFSKQLREQPRTFHREIASYFKDILYKDARLHAMVTWSNNVLQQSIADMTILPSNHTTNAKLYVQPRIRTVIGECFFESNDFMKICNDAEFTFFTLVVSVFIILVVGILYFFQSAEISYSRMAS